MRRIIMTFAASAGLAFYFAGLAPAGQVVSAGAASAATARPAAAVTSLTEGLLSKTPAVAFAAAALPTSAPASSTPICSGTSLRSPSHGNFLIRVPTVGNGTPGQWGCDLLPSNVAGLVPVERLQIDLNDCYGYNLTVDGEYGPATTNAVMGVQKDEDVTPDGDYGPVTIVGTGGDGFEYQGSGQPAGVCGRMFGG